MFNLLSDFLGLGLVFGLFFTITLYLIAKFNNRPTPPIRTGALIITVLTLFMLMPKDNVVLKFALELVILAIIFSIFLRTIHSYNFIKFLNKRKIENIIAATYFIALLIGTSLILTKSYKAIFYVSDILEKIIIFIIGIIIAIKILWQAPEIHNTSETFDQDNNVN